MDDHTLFLFGEFQNAFNQMAHGQISHDDDLNVPPLEGFHPAVSHLLFVRRLSLEDLLR